MGKHKQSLHTRMYIAIIIRKKFSFRLFFFKYFSTMDVNISCTGGLNFFRKKKIWPAANFASLIGEEKFTTRHRGCLLNRLEIVGFLTPKLNINLKPGSSWSCLMWKTPIPNGFGWLWMVLDGFRWIWMFWVVFGWVLVRFVYFLNGLGSFWMVWVVFGWFWLVSG